ncbi:MAG TPA: DM13 domain-containing protein [bacterium]|nr:DM13 domain-containing protein [bacterium]
MRRRWRIAVLVLLVVGVPIAWYLGSPLFLNRTVSETFAPQEHALAAGRFTAADSFHRGSGIARLVQTASGHEVRFEEFRVTNGPDLYVYLAVHPQPRSRADVDQGFVTLGRLKGNIGPQSYALPAALDRSRYRSIVIYCRAFHVVFATAELAAP